MNMMSIWKFVAIGVLIFLSGGAFCAEANDWLNVSPESGRRIFPEPNAVLNHDPVAFFWPLVDGASAYTLTVSGKTSSAQIRTVTNYHVLSQPLPAGSYTWQVTAQLSGKTLVGVARPFELQAPVNHVGDTDPNHLIALLSNSSRPRFFPKGDEWTKISLSLTSNRRALVDSIIKRAASPPKANAALNLMSSKGSVLSPTDRVAIKRDATFLCTDLEDSALLWRISKDEKWRSRAHAIVSVIKSIDHPALYSDPYDLLSARYVLWARVIAYDWMFDAFEPQERDELRAQIEAGMLWLNSQLMDPKRGLGRQPFDSHASEVMGAVVVGAASLIGESSSAEKVFRELLPLYLANLLPSVSTDGAAGTSGTYAIWDISAYNVPHWDALRWATGINISNLTQVRHLSEWLVRSAPPDAPGVWWGDGAETLKKFEWEGAANLLAPRLNDSLLNWYSGKVAPPQYPTVWLALAPVIALSGAAPKPDATPKFKVFPLAGLGMLNVDLENPKAASVYLKSSPFGSENHGHYDQNSFVIAYQGRMLAIDSGAYDYWGSDHYFGWYKRTVAHNAITWDGGVGQEGKTQARGSLDASGKIVSASETNGVAFVVGDATKAYGPDVKHAKRTIAYLPSGVVAVFDSLVADTPRRWEWNLHALSAKLQPSGAIELTNGPANACVDLYSNNPASTTIARQQSPGVQREWGMASHDHLVYAQDVATKQTQIVALFRLDCKPLTNIVNFKNGAANLQIGSTNMQIDQDGVKNAGSN
jgi:hypothetical protein